MPYKPFHREEYPLDILSEFGLTEEMIYDLPDYVHERLEAGLKSPLLPISIRQPFGLTHCYAKFCLTETEDGIDVLFSPKLKEADLSSFTDKERSLLLAGKVIVSDIEETLLSADGEESTQKIKAFVQLDRDTNGVVYSREWVAAKNYMRCATLSGDDGDAKAKADFTEKAKPLYKIALEKVKDDTVSLKELQKEMKSYGL